jgi:hypothetical protein
MTFPAVHFEGNFGVDSSQSDFRAQTTSKLVAIFVCAAFRHGFGDNQPDSRGIAGVLHA